MRRLVLLSLALASPASAQSQLSPAQIGNAFCAAILAGDAAALGLLLTPDLADKAADHEDIRWSSGDAAPVGCMPVGASGSTERPESVLFLTFPGGKTASDRLVLAFVDGDLRIDDVSFDRGGTLRARLAAQ